MIRYCEICEREVDSEWFWESFFTGHDEHVCVCPNCSRSWPVNSTVIGTLGPLEIAKIKRADPMLYELYKIQFEGDRSPAGVH